MTVALTVSLLRYQSVTSRSLIYFQLGLQLKQILFMLIATLKWWKLLEPRLELNSETIGKGAYALLY